MKISYIGKVRFLCDMCKNYTNKRFKAEPSIEDLADWESLSICKPCAKREIGKSKKWEKLNGISR